MRLKLRHGHAQRFYQAQYALVRHELLRPVVHSPRHPAAAILIAVVYDGQRVHIFVKAQRRVERYLRAVKRLAGLRVHHGRAVYAHVVAYEGQGAQLLRYAAEYPPRRRHDVRALFRRAPERRDILRRYPLLAVEQRSVKVERYQPVIHLRLHAHFVYLA